MRARVILFGFAVTALTACVLDATGLGTATTEGTSSSATASSSSGAGGSSSSSSSSSSGGGQGGAAPVGDPIPIGAVSFFLTAACPTGWDPYLAADGRLILPAMDPAKAGTTHGSPLMNGEDRGHAHTIDTSFALSSFKLAGASGSNDGIAAAGTVPFQTTTDPTSTHLPYVQLLVCKKTATPGSGPIPAGMHLFFEGSTCPSPFQPASATAGRFLVALPTNAPPDQPFGGAPLASTDTRTHTHSVSAELQTDAHGVVLASGCCNDGFAQHDTYTTVAPSGESEPELPYLELIQCVKM
ncbi:MAG: hypothetical protein QM820_41190 [Minicystis sp.]